MNNLTTVVDKRGEKSRGQEKETAGNAVDAEMIMDTFETPNENGNFNCKNNKFVGGIGSNLNLFL